jgi:hypothetical protein
MTRSWKTSEPDIAALAVTSNTDDKGNLSAF